MPGCCRGDGCLRCFSLYVRCEPVTNVIHGWSTISVVSNVLTVWYAIVRQVENTWSIMSTKLDPDGWQYTTRLDSAYWYPQNDSSLCKCLSMIAEQA
jgi:hypothetical protein